MHTAIKMIGTLGCAMMLVSAGRAHAAEITATWTGNGVTNRWAEPANWNPVGVPNNSGDTTYHVIIEGGPDEDVQVLIDTAPINIQTLTIKEGNTLTMDAPGSLFIRGGLLALDGTLQVNPKGVGLARLFFVEQDAHVTGIGEIHMLGGPGNCLIQAGGGVHVTLGDGALASNDTVLRGGGVLQGASGSSFKVLERIVADIDAVDLVFFFVTVEVDALIEACGGDVSFTNSSISGSGLIENTGSNIIGMQNATFDGADGLTVRGNVDVFTDSSFFDVSLESGLVQIDLSATATLDDVIADSITINGNNSGSVELKNTAALTNTTLEDLQMVVEPATNVIYASVESNGVFKSTDAGQTWTLHLEGENTITGGSLSGAQVNLASDATIVLSNTLLSDSTIEGDADSDDDALTIAGNVNCQQVVFRWGDVKLLEQDATLTVSDTTVEHVTVQGNPNAPQPQLVAEGEWIVSDTLLIDVSGEVADHSTLTINNVFFNTTTFTGGVEAILKMQAQARIDNGTFDALDLILTGEPFIMAANGPVTLENLTLAIDGQTQIKTDSGATMHVESSNVTAGSEGSVWQADPDIDFVFADGDAMVNVPTTTSGNIDAIGFGTLIFEEDITADRVFVATHQALTLEDILAVLFVGLEVQGRAELRRINAVLKRLEAAESAELEVDADLNLAGGDGEFSVINIEEAFIFAMTDEANWFWGDDSVLAMIGGVAADVGEWESWGRLEVGGADSGDTPDGYDNNFDLSILRIGEGAHVYLEDAIDNGNRMPGLGSEIPEALYVDVLEFADGEGVLNRNGLSIYYGTLVGSADQIIDIPVVKVDLPGDLDGDGAVGVPDLLLLLGMWGQCNDCAPGECVADLDGNCAVGVADLLLLLANWG